MKPPTKFFICALVLLFVLAATGGFMYLEARKFLDTPASAAFGVESHFFYLTVEQGSSFDQVARQLYAEGGISDVTRFKLLGRFKQADDKIKAGEFEFNTGWTPPQVLEQLVIGRTLLHRVTIPEGLPWWETAAVLERGGFINSADFADIITDGGLLKRYGIPFNTAEGFLFPDTYLLHKARVPGRAQVENVVLTLVQTFWSKTASIWEEAALAAQLAPAPVVSEIVSSGHVIAGFVPPFARSYPDEVKRIVTLASLVEKESAVSDERPRVSGVYSNRLRINMPLQCDPTIIYGLGGNFRGAILRSHLADGKNTYNTYKYYGLPPGPICSPGLESIHAAFKPEMHKFFYFVATGKSDGRHVFSQTLNEHNAAVQKYRQAILRRK